MASQSNNVANKKTVTYMPEDVIENILSFLPIKKLCSLSVLSRRFRNSWKFCRNLSFDRDFAARLSRTEYQNFINSFFSNGSISSADIFKLYYDATEERDRSAISRWIERAVRLSIKELDLDFSPSTGSGSLSYTLFNVASLTVLKLVKCEVHLPADSNGLRNLREVTFQDARAQPETVEAVFANCKGLRSMTLIRCSSVKRLKALGPVLETLVLKDCFHVDSIAVDSPRLRTFHYHGKIAEFNFYCEMPQLSDVIMEIAHPRTFQLLSDRENAVERLAYLKTWTVTSTVLEGLTARYKDGQYKEMEFFLWKLEELHLIVAPESFLNPSDLIIFLRRCPHIERIFINLGKNAFGHSLYWDLYGKNYMSHCQVIFPFLKFVKITGFSMRELPVYMARYFLKNAIHLQSLVLVKARIHYFPEFYNPECLRLGVITNAEIHIEEYHKDKSALMPKHLRDI